MDSGKIKAIALARCGDTSYARSFNFESGSNTIKFSLSKYEVANFLDLEIYLVANEGIPDYSCPDEFNPIYFGEGKSTMSFTLRKGDLLAKDHYVLDIDDSKISGSIGSIFSIIKMTDDEAKASNVNIFVDYENDKIRINLKPDLYDVYHCLANLNSSLFRRYTAAVIVYPVLVEVVSEIFSPHDDAIERRRWYRTIQYFLKRLSIDEDASFSRTEIANKLLGNISFDALAKLKEMHDTDYNGTIEDDGGDD